MALEEYGIPQDLSLRMHRLRKSLKNDEIIEYKKIEYRIQMIDFNCTESLTLTGEADNETYIVLNI